MQIIIDDDRIARGARIGKIATFAGLGFLGVGLIVSLFLQETSLFWLSLVFLVLGVFVSSLGVGNMNRWVREPRADQALADALKGFDDRYLLYSYVLPVPHVLLSPVGIWVLAAMGQDGVIRYEDGKFRRNFSLVRLLRFMAEEGMGKPFAEVEGQVQDLRSFLTEHGVDGEIEIQKVLVFYNPAAKLEVSDPPLPVVDPKGLKKVIRKEKDSKLPGDLYKQIEDLFDEEAGWFEDEDDQE